MSVEEKKIVICWSCKSATTTSNKTWCKCDNCKSRIWIGTSPPYKPGSVPRIEN